MKIKIADVNIEERQRSDFKDLQALAANIEEMGQLVPIIVEKETNRLLAGERRIQALRLLGREEVDAVFQEDLTDVQRYKIELMENIMREDLNWDEKVKAIAELARMEQGAGEVGKPGPSKEFGPDKPRAKSYDEIAKGIGISKAKLVQDVEMAKALEMFPRLAKEQNKTTAYKRYKRALSSAISRELLSRGDIKMHDELKLGKAEELIKREGNETIDLILFDPPFGIDLDSAGSQGRSAAGEDYEFDDTLVSSRALCTQLFPEFHRVMKSTSAMFVFYPVQHYQWFYEELVKVFGQKGVFKVPLIWYKGRGGTLFTGLSFSGAYETFFFVRKGKLAVLKDRGDVFDYPRVHGQKRIHVAEKPVALYTDLIEATTQVGSTVLDPTFGSGASIEAALRSNRKVIGFEMSSAVYARAATRIDAVRVMLQSVEEEEDDEQREAEEQDS